MQGIISRNIQQILSRNSLFHSLLLGITVVICTMVLIGTALHYSQIYFTALNKAETDAQMSASELSEIIAAPVWNIDYDTVDRIIAIYSDNNTVLRVRVEETDGRLIVERISNATDQAHKILSHDINYNGRCIGRVITHLTFAPVKTEQHERLIYYIMMACLLLITILLLTKHILTTYLTTPLRQLEVMIEQLSAGDYPAKCEPPKTRELATIANSFAEMARQVAQREHELKAINNMLSANIEQRIEVEKKLRASQERFSIIAANTIDGIVDHPINSGQLYYSQRWKQLLGYTDKELTNSIATWISRVHPEDLNAVNKLSHGLDYDENDHVEREYRMLHKDGQYRWFLGRTHIVRDEKGMKKRIVGTHTDITVRKNTEQHLINSKEMLQDIINCMPSLIVGVTEKLKISLWNETAQENTGIASSEAEGRNFKNLFPELAFIERYILKSLETDKAVTVPKVTSISHGTAITYDIVIFPITIGENPTAVMRIDDITKRLHMEEMIVQTEKMASISGLAAGMAHEINNPLGGILQGVQNIQRRLSNKLAPNMDTAKKLGFTLEQLDHYLAERDIYSLLEGISSCGTRAASIVANMLEFSRRPDTKQTSTDLHDTIEKSISLAANDYSLKMQHGFESINIQREFDESLPNINCAPQEIEQVLLNLLKNAAQAMGTTDEPIDNPTIAITTQHTPTGVMITVSDNGPGMEEDVRKRVFEPFYTTKPVGEGTGLGLSVSYYIITNNHSGTITVTSARGHGTAFEISLPQAG